MSDHLISLWISFKSVLKTTIGEKKLRAGTNRLRLRQKERGGAMRMRKALVMSWRVAENLDLPWKTDRGLFLDCEAGTQLCDDTQKESKYRSSRSRDFAPNASFVEVWRTERQTTADTQDFHPLVALSLFDCKYFDNGFLRFLNENEDCTLFH